MEAVDFTADHWGGRADLRTKADQNSSVEFVLVGVEPIYRYRIHDISLSGIAIIISAGSSALKHLKVGERLNLKYRPAGSSDLSLNLRTETKHITKIDCNGDKRGYLVGLFLLEN